MLFDDTKHEDDKAVYDTPWGKRELGNREAGDLRHQGLPITLAEGPAETSLEDEKAAMSGVKLTGEPADGGGDGGVPDLGAQSGTGDPTADKSTTEVGDTKPNPLFKR